METLQFFLFGQLKTLREGQPGSALEPHRAQELLAYLLLYHDHLHTREKLATLWWGDKPTTQSKRYLRQTLWQVQSSLNQLTAGLPRLLWVDYGRIGIDPQANYWLDVAMFERAFNAVDQIPGDELTVQQAELLQRTLPLYQGDLLEGWYQDWCIYERERYQNMYLAMLDKLLAYSTAHHLYEAGVTYGEQILRCDHAREETHRQLMHLHYQAGNRTAAIYQYEACVTALRKELEVEPAQSTIALYKQICREQNHAPAPVGAGVGILPSSLSLHGEHNHRASPMAPAYVTDGHPSKQQAVRVMDELEHIQSTLAQLQAQVAHLMQELARKNLAKS